MGNSLEKALGSRSEKQGRRTSAPEPGARARQRSPSGTPSARWGGGQASAPAGSSPHDPGPGARVVQGSDGRRYVQLPDHTTVDITDDPQAEQIFHRVLSRGESRSPAEGSQGHSHIATQVHAGALPSAFVPEIDGSPFEDPSPRQRRGSWDSRSPLGAAASRAAAIPERGPWSMQLHKPRQAFRVVEPSPSPRADPPWTPSWEQQSLSLSSTGAGSSARTPQWGSANASAGSFLASAQTPPGPGTPAGSGPRIGALSDPNTPASAGPGGVRAQTPPILGLRITEMHPSSLGGHAPSSPGGGALGNARGSPRAKGQRRSPGVPPNSRTSPPLQLRNSPPSPGWLTYKSDSTTPTTVATAVSPGSATGHTPSFGRGTWEPRPEQQPTPTEIMTDRMAHEAVTRARNVYPPQAPALSSSFASNKALFRPLGNQIADLTSRNGPEHTTF